MNYEKNSVLEKAKIYVHKNYSDSLIECLLWASRGSETSMKDITDAIEKAKK